MLHDTEFELFRDSYRRFLKEQVAPYYEQWEHEGLIPRDLWLRLGENGFLCVDVPEEYGGYGAPVHYSLMLVQETAQAGFASLAVAIGGQMSWSLLIYKILDLKSKNVIGYPKW